MRWTSSRARSLAAAAAERTNAFSAQFIMLLFKKKFVSIYLSISVFISNCKSDSNESYQFSLVAVVVPVLWYCTLPLLKQSLRHHQSTLLESTINKIIVVRLVTNNSLQTRALN